MNPLLSQRSSTKVLLSLFISVFFKLVVLAETIVPFTNIIGGVVDNSDRYFSSSALSQYETMSINHSGLSKIFTIDNSAMYYSTTDYWPQGSWGRGYASYYSPNQFYTTQTSDNSNEYYSCHPLIRECHEFLTAHIYDYLAGTNTSQNLTKIQQGIDYLLQEQTSSGAFIYWKTRYTQSSISSYSPPNVDEEYETAHGLHALCEYYLSEIDYRRSEVYNAIITAQAWLKLFDWACTNQNVRGLGLWALSNSFKITKDCGTSDKIEEISYFIISEQRSIGDWATGGVEWDSTYNFPYEHDQRSAYHFMILRGLVEAYAVLPHSIFTESLVNALKKSINHVINYRTTVGYTGFLYVYYPGINFTSGDYYLGPYDESKYLEPLIKLYYYSNGSYYFSDAELASIKNLTNMAIKWMNLSYKYHFRSAAMYNYYWGKMINGLQALNWAGDTPNYVATDINNRVVTGDFDNDGKKDDIAAFCDYGSRTAIQVWKANGIGVNLDYGGDKTYWIGDDTYAFRYDGKIVSGDFDNDGYEDDIAAMYDYGNSTVRIWVFCSNGSSFSTTNYYTNTSFVAANAEYRFTSGDFDNDGFKDDIALFYSYGGNSTTIWVLKSLLNTSTGNYYFNAYPYFSTTTGFNANNVKGNVVSGDFDNDGRFDDIMAFYDYGNGTTKAWAFLSNGSSLVSSEYWYGPDCSANMASKRYVSGDFDNDGNHDDIAALFDAGTAHMRFWIFKSNGTSLVAHNHSENYTFNALNVTGRVVSGDFNNNGKTDGVMTLYDYGTSTSWIYMFPFTLFKTHYTSYQNSWSQNSNPCPDGVINITPCRSRIANFSENPKDLNNSKTPKQKSEIVIAPNPVEDELQIISQHDIISMTILNLAGQKLQTLCQSDNRIDVSDLPSGYYVLRIETDSGPISQSFVKK